MAKEALFNILNNQFELEGLDALDLFAGTGSISYEFFSRGCASITTVDQNIKCVKYIRETKEKLNMETLEVVHSNCFGFLEKAWKKYDIIFADPPYDMLGFEKVVELVFEKELLNKGGVLIVEHSKNTVLNHFSQFVNTRKYGSVHFSFFQESD